MTTRIDWGSVGAWLRDHKKAVLIAAGLVVLILGSLFAADRISTWRDNRNVAKKKAKIANNLQQVNTLNGQINQLQGQKTEVQQEIAKDVLDLANDVSANETARRETNAAMSNYNTAIKANTNVDVTAADLQKALDRLNAQGGQ